MPSRGVHGCHRLQPIRSAVLDGNGDGMNQDAKDLLESSRIQWERDWDALLIGFVLGVLSTLVVGFGWRVFFDLPVVGR